MSGRQREGGWCKPYDGMAGKALWSAGRKWPAGPRRYRERVRISQMRIQVEPRTFYVRPEPTQPAQGVFVYSV